LLDETSCNVEFWSEASTSLTCKRASSRRCFALADVKALKSECHRDLDVPCNSKLLKVYGNRIIRRQNVNF